MAHDDEIVSEPTENARGLRWEDEIFLVRRLYHLVVNSRQHLHFSIRKTVFLSENIPSWSPFRTNVFVGARWCNQSFRFPVLVEFEG